MLHGPMHYWDAVFAFVVAMVVAAVLTPFAARLARRDQRGRRCRANAASRQRTTPLLGRARDPRRRAGRERAVDAARRSGCRARAHQLRGERSRTVHTWVVIGRRVPDRVGRRDRRPARLPPLVKLVGQIGAAVIAVEGGAVVTDVTLPFVGSLQFPHVGGVLTVIWLVGLMNVVNFSDGVDGLAAGLCAIDGIAFAIIAFDLGVSGAAILAALTAGAALGFLFHNFHPASVFMGDSGANLLGYLLGVVAVVGSLKTNAVVALAGAAA